MALPVSWPRGGQQAGAAQANGSCGLITGDGDPREQGSGTGQSGTQASRGVVGVGSLGDHKALHALAGSGSTNPGVGEWTWALSSRIRGVWQGRGAQKTKRRR